MNDITINSIHALTLPRLNATQAASLSRRLVATAKPKGGGLSLPSAIAEALADVEQTYPKLLAALVAPSDEMPGIRKIDIQLDGAWVMVRDWTVSWTRLPVGHSQGDMARKILADVFDGGLLDFISLPVEDERTMSDAKLKLIAEQGYESLIVALGGAPLLAHLREVNEKYGAAIDALQATDASTTVRNVRDPFNDTRTSLRSYLATVQASVKRGKHETLELAGLLLRPLIEWDRSQASGGDDATSTALDPAKPGAPV